jgi:hypothetical protein
LKRIWPFLVFFLLFAGNLRCEEENPVPKKSFHEMDEFERMAFDSLYPRISDKYRAGSSLIYDCAERHFACVNQTSYEQCEERRAVSLEKRRAILSCAPLKHFANLDLCVEELYRVIHSSVNKEFCLLPKGEALRF